MADKKPKEDYDYASAEDAGLKRDKSGHMPSRVPKTGLILKLPGHKTLYKTRASDKRLGYGVRKDPKTGRQYSKKDPNLIRAPYPSRRAILNREDILLPNGEFVPRDKHLLRSSILKRKKKPSK